jgi:hypothetical protein
LHHINPGRVIFEDEEIDRVNRILMSRWMGHGDPRIWDAMTYADQCDALEVARAVKANERYDAQQARAQARRRRTR